MDPVRDQSVLKFSASSPPRDLSRPGFANRALMDAARKAAGDLVAGLKKYQAQLQQEGPWFRLILLGSTPKLQAKVEKALRQKHPSLKALPKAPGWDLRSTMGSVDMSMAIDKMLKDLAEGEEFCTFYRQGRVMIVGFSGC